ncbi:MAG: hypothetical protein K5764_08270 [Prevotella sp.]|nr:hypothetical protein [Prevotella sp.]
MKKLLTMLCLLWFTIGASAQHLSPTEQLKANPRKAYGNDYPYQQEAVQLTKAPKGYKPFYISLYARHGSRYYWNDRLYKELDTLLTAARERHQLTADGEAFYTRFMAAKQELITGVSELTQLGWEQHQGIARTMYNRFPEVFKKGGNVLAVSSLVGRCVLSMSAFCQELVQCNPEIEIREQSSRFTLDAVVPDDRQNPVKHTFGKPKPRYEQHRNQFKGYTARKEKEQLLLSRLFTSTDGLPGNPNHIASNLFNLYTSLPNIGHEGMMGSLLTDEEVASQWEASNLGSYSWVFGSKYMVIPILQDIIQKSEAVIKGSSDHIADLRFGHDSYIGPLTVLMGINGADRDPEDPYEVKNCYQNWQTCKACNIQLVFYRSKKAGADILVKCLLNGVEAALPVPTTQAPYYKWTDFREFYTSRCQDTGIAN